MIAGTFNAGKSGNVMAEAIIVAAGRLWRLPPKQRAVRIERARATLARKRRRRFVAIVSAAGG